MRIGIDCRVIFNKGVPRSPKANGERRTRTKAKRRPHSPEGGAEFEVRKSEQAGVGQYTLFLVQHLLRLEGQNEYILFFDAHADRKAVKELIGNRRRTKARFFSGVRIPFFSSHMLAARTVAREACDVFHGPANHLPYTYKGPAVLTVHDLAILKHPEWFPESWLTRFISTRILLPRAIARAKCIMVPSRATAKALHHFFNVSEDRTRIIPLGVTVPAPGGGSSFPELVATRYVLFVGTIEPRKNLTGLIRAFRKLLEEHKDLQNTKLVIAGARGWKEGEVFREIARTRKQFANQEPVRYLGYVSDDDKFALMRGATAFVFPSYYEGFGLPVLEAMAVGTPVITTRAGALAEVAGEAALFVEPGDEAALTSALGRVLREQALRDQLSERGRAQAAQFSWQETAKQTLVTYKEVARG